MKLKVKFQAGQLSVLRDGQVVLAEKNVRDTLLTIILYRDGASGMGEFRFQSQEWELEALVPPAAESLVSANLPV